MVALGKLGSNTNLLWGLKVNTNVVDKHKAKFDKAKVDNTKVKVDKAESMSKCTGMLALRAYIFFHFATCLPKPFAFCNSMTAKTFNCIEMYFLRFLIFF